MNLTEAAIEYSRKHPDVIPSEIAKRIGCSGRTARRAVQTARDMEILLCSDDMVNEHMLDQMVGFKKSTIPMKYRRVLANIVKHTEMALSRVPNINLKHSRTSKESANLLISDFHTGKQVFDDVGNCLYNKDIVAFKFAALKGKVIELLTEHLKIERIDQFNVLILGDIVDGSGIYPNQELNQDLTWIIDQIALAVAGIWDIVLAVRNIGLPVNIYGVPGNHGRQGKEAPLQNNFDYMVYQQLYMLANFGKEKQVFATYSKGTPYLNLEIKGWRTHIRHIAPAQTETPAARAKFGGWQGIHKWDIICYAHLHHPGAGTYLKKPTIMNGSPIGIDDFSEGLAKESRPSQALFGIAPGRVGKSFTYDVYLDDYGMGDEAKLLLMKYPMLCRVS